MPCPHLQTTMTIEIKKVISKSELDLFMSLPSELYKRFAEYVSPLMKEIRELLDPKSASFFKYGEATYWLAYKNGAPVGRISAQIDNAQPTSAYGNAGLFGCLDVIDDIEVTTALFNVAENWLKEKGFEGAVGPFMLNINGQSGLLVEGHDLEPLTMTPWHPPYLENHLERLGFQQVRDLYFWRLQWSAEMEANYTSRQKLPDLPKGVTMRPLDFKNMDRDVEFIRQVFNDAWSDNWGFAPLQPEDVQAFSKELKPILRPEMGVIVEKQGKLLAVLLLIPNLFEFTGDLGTKPSPIGWLKLAWRVFRYRFNSARVLLFGVSKEIRHSVGGAVIAMWTINHLVTTLINLKRKQGWIEAGWVLDNNAALQSILTKHGFQKARTLRLFKRQFDT